MSLTNRSNTAAGSPSLADSVIIINFLIGICSDVKLADAIDNSSGLNILNPVSAFLNSSAVLMTGTDKVAVNPSIKSISERTSRRVAVPMTNNLRPLGGILLNRTSRVWRIAFEKRGPIGTYSKIRSISSTTITLVGDL